MSAREPIPRAAAAGRCDARPEPLGVVDGVHVFRLANGLVILLEPMAGAASVAGGIWLPVGSRDEAADENGIAHFLEHMLFKGTTSRDARAIASSIEDVGGQLDAHTARDHTAIHGRVLAADAPLLVELIADLVMNPAFAEEELVRERTVVLQEIAEIEDDEEESLHDLLQETAFPDQPLGRPILGRAEIVAGFSREAVRGFHRRHYHATGAVLAFAGALEPQPFARLLAQHFAAMPKGRRPARAPARYRGGRAVAVKDCEQLHLALALPSLPQADPALAALQCLATLLGGGMSSRLFQRVREERGLAYSVYAAPSAFEETGLLALVAPTAPGAGEEVLAIMCAELKDALAHPRADEIARAKAQLEAGLLMARENAAVRAEQRARQWMVHGRVLGLDELVARIAAVDEAAVSGLAETLLAAPPTLAAIGPDDRIRHAADRHLAALGR